ncbi:ABC transporter permease [Methanoregula sp. UBA64]|jgi:ABC-2 type transport system permease protein|uniref:ABC transporter permease n=1 Tax=Methanoregula sp. UBA64 TaxID=1915554 RepID=UPI0025F6CA76|nr:ABC transporter permease [Methanoregula sp. UBA64]
MPSTENHEPAHSRIARELSAAWAIATKDMRIYYLKPNIIVSGILFPLFMFLAFAIGKNAPAVTLIPGLIAITLLFSASSIEPVSIPIERRVKTFDRLLAAPISFHTLVIGESMSGFLYSLGIACIPLAIGLVVFRMTVLNAAILAAAMILTAFCFATLGTLFAAYPTENVGEVMSMLNLVRLPLIFISGVFIPLTAMPAIGQEIALLSPLTYGNDLIQYAVTGVTQFSVAADIAALAVFILVFQYAANGLYKKFNE